MFSFIHNPVYGVSIIGVVYVVGFALKFFIPEGSPSWVGMFMPLPIMNMLVLVGFALGNRGSQTTIAGVIVGVFDVMTIAFIIFMNISHRHTVTDGA